MHLNLIKKYLMLIKRKYLIGKYPQYTLLLLMYNAWHIYFESNEFEIQKIKVVST
jgi:hypothetical protein